jgi:hypothetical protein
VYGPFANKFSELVANLSPFSSTNFLFNGKNVPKVVNVSKYGVGFSNSTTSVKSPSALTPS